MADSAPTKSENPYLAVVARKGRNLKKKLQNIQKAETQLESGKALNEEQLILLSTKPSVERALFDVEAIKTQLEEVAKELDTQQPEAVQPEAVVQETVVVEETIVVEVATGTSPVEQVAMSTQYETAAPTAADQPVYDQELMQSVLQAHVRKLLKTLHVCSRYHTITGTNLPPDVDYFGKCLLGMTSIGDFEDALSQSVKNATLFLDPVIGAEHEAIRGMNFVELSELIDHLAGHIDGGASTDNNMESFLSALATPPPQPDINFFGTNEIIDEPAPVAVSEPEPVVVNDAPVQDTVEVSEPSEAAPKKQKEFKRERKPRADKKKENKDTVATDAAPAKPVSTEGKSVRSDKPKPDRKKPTPVPAATENAAPVTIEVKPEKPPRAPRVRKEKSVPVENTPPPVPAPAAKPAAPISYSAAVAPQAAPVVTKPTKAPVPRNAGPKPTSASKAPRAPAAAGEKKQWK